MSVSGLASTATAASTATQAAATRLTTSSSSLLQKTLNNASEGFKTLGTLLFTRAGAAVSLAALAVGVVALLHYKFSILTPVIKSMPSASATSSVFKKILQPVKAVASRIPFLNRSSAHPHHQQQIEEGLKNLAAKDLPPPIPSAALPSLVGSELPTLSSSELSAAPSLVISSPREALAEAELKAAEKAVAKAHAQEKAAEKAAAEAKAAEEVQEQVTEKRTGIWGRFFGRT